MRIIKRWRDWTASSGGIELAARDKDLAEALVGFTANLERRAAVRQRLKAEAASRTPTADAGDSFEEARSGSSAGSMDKKSNGRS